jgi:hypothetical protein
MIDMSYKNDKLYESYHSHMQHLQRQDIQSHNHSSVSGTTSHVPTAADYENLFGSEGSDIVAKTVSVRYDPWLHAPQGFQRHQGESHFPYMERWQNYKQDRDMRAHQETVLANEDIDFALCELRTYMELTEGRRRDLDPRFQYNLVRLVKKAEDTLSDLTKCHKEQARVDLRRFFDGPYESPYDRRRPPILPYTYHDPPDYWNLWDTPSGPQNWDSPDM